MTSRYPATRLGLSVLLVLICAVPAQAETSPEAFKWLEKMGSAYEQGPFTVGYSADIDMSATGQGMAAIKGTITQRDRRHSRMEASFDMQGGQMTVNMLMVSDGETAWTEMDMAALGVKQVMKLDLDQAEELTSQGLGFGSPGGFDPVAQLTGLTKLVDFKIADTSNGRVTLEGTPKEGAPGLPEGIDAFDLVLDEKTGFPVEMRMRGDQPSLNMKFHDFRYVDASSLDEALFSYTPPEGTNVTDLGPVLEAQLSANGEG